MSKVWAAGPKKHVDRYVLLAIADNANSEGFAYPSLRFLANKTRLSERTVMRAIQTLEQDGWLVRKKRSRDAKYSTYNIILERLTDDSESRDSEQGQVTRSPDEVTRAARSSDCGDIPPPIRKNRQ
jgi:DNA-binding transcriptional MocR family regulator